MRSLKTTLIIEITSTHSFMPFLCYQTHEVSSNFSYIFTAIDDVVHNLSGDKVFLKRLGASNETLRKQQIQRCLDLSTSQQMNVKY